MYTVQSSLCDYAGLATSLCLKWHVIKVDPNINQTNYRVYSFMINNPEVWGYAQHGSVECFLALPVRDHWCMMRTPHQGHVMNYSTGFGSPAQCQALWMATTLLDTLQIGMARLQSCTVVFRKWAASTAPLPALQIGDPILDPEFRISRSGEGV